MITKLTIRKKIKAICGDRNLLGKDELDGLVEFVYQNMLDAQNYTKFEYDLAD